MEETLEGLSKVFMTSTNKKSDSRVRKASKKRVKKKTKGVTLRKRRKCDTVSQKRKLTTKDKGKKIAITHEDYTGADDTGDNENEYSDDIMKKFAMRNEDGSIHCKQCPYEYENRRNFVVHVARCHMTEEKGRVYYCTACPANFPTVRERKNHLCPNKSEPVLIKYAEGYKNGDRKLPIKCKICSYTTNKKTYFQNHIIKRHADDEDDDTESSLMDNKGSVGKGKVQKSQDNPSSSRSNQEVLTNNEDGNSDDIVKKFSTKDSISGVFCCNKCPNEYKKRRDILVHILRCHTDKKGKRKYYCSTCPESFLSENARKDHFCPNRTDPMLEKYAEGYRDGNRELPVKCTACSCVTNKRRYFLQHIMSKHESNNTSDNKETYECHDCGKVFRQKRTLANHISFSHLQIVPDDHRCDVCGKVFANKTHTMEHRNIHTGETPFVCELCGKGFTSNAGLIAHRKSELGLKTVPCDYCPQKFLNQHDKKMHVLRHHTHEKNVVCDVCGRRFYDRKRLREHVAIHSEERPHSCATCGASFKMRKTLRQHYKVHNRKTSTNSEEPQSAVNFSNIKVHNRKPAPDTEEMESVVNFSNCKVNNRKTATNNEDTQSVMNFSIGRPFWGYKIFGQDMY